MKTIETNCVICKKEYSVRRAEQNVLIILSNCAICGKKNSKFINNQEASILLSQLGIKPPLRNIPLFGDILF